ncbi:MAG: hypothetical protein V1778_00700 [bacterium]
MPTPKKPREQESAQTAKPVAPEPHRHKFIWNWRMIVLGLLLNIATLVLVVYTVSLLHDYRQCTQDYSSSVTSKALRESAAEPTTVPTNANLNTNATSTTNASVPVEY